MQINMTKFNNVYNKNSQKTGIKKEFLQCNKAQVKKKNRANIILDKQEMLWLEDQEQIK